MRLLLPTTFFLGLCCSVVLVPSAWAGQNAQLVDEVPAIAGQSDNPSHPLGDRQTAQRLQGLQARLNGKAKGHTHEVAKGQFVELSREGEDSIWTVVAQFGNQINPTYGGTPGPVRNQIPEPNRQFDNATIWAPDFTKQYYENLLFSGAPGAISMRNFYIELSSNRYTVNGAVTDWVQVPFNEQNYGSNYCGGIVCARTWLYVRDAVNAWYNGRIAAGWTLAQINNYLSQFDRWDRYDYDGDGNFNEPDGYIDHFQTIHAGEGEETGGGAQGEGAIWSHRWYAFYNNIGVTGPPFNHFGGIQIGASNYWIGDYTVEPENGGVGVFAHEFGHDLGLPDLYDTSGNTGGAENSTGFWTLYSSGSYGASGAPADGLGTKPIHMSAYEKIFLGWSNYEVVNFGDTRALTLGPAETNTRQAQQLVVLLPDKVVVSNVGPPYAGSQFYFSGTGNGIDNTMTRGVALPGGAVALNAKVRYNVELDFDYVYLTVNGTPVATNLSSATNPDGNNLGNGITGSSSGNWVTLTANLSAYAGQTVTLGFRYKTDPGVSLTRNGDVIHAETGFLNNPNLQNWVEHFPYQDGLLMWYYDTSFPDNNVGDHCLAGRCGGLVLPVDAHPDLLLRPDNGKVWRARVQAYDSTFGLSPTDVVCLHANSVGQCYGNLAANSMSDDTQSYWVAPNPGIGNFGWASVPLPGTGTTVRVTAVAAHGEFLQVIVAPK